MNAKQQQYQFVQHQQPTLNSKPFLVEENKMPMTDEQQRAQRACEQNLKTAETIKAFGVVVEQASKYLQEHFAPNDPNFETLQNAFMDAAANQVDDAERRERKLTFEQKGDIDRIASSQASDNTGLECSNSKLTRSFATRYCKSVFYSHCKFSPAIKVVLTVS